MTVDSYEFVLARQPFVVRHRVRWSDCDPAGVVFTGKFSEYLLGAVNLFMAELGGGDYAKWIETLDVDTPCKGLALTFHSALWPEDDCVLACAIGVVRESSFDITVEATRALDSRNPGRAVFSGVFSPICISRSVRKKTPIPQGLLDGLAPYRNLG